MTQQFTCPKCLKDYTSFTIVEHYVCGVEPFEAAKEKDPEHPAAFFTNEITFEEAKKLYPSEFASNTTETTNTEQPFQGESQKPDQKKRGRKPKAK